MEPSKKPLLNNPDIYPDNQVLNSTLTDSFEAYNELIKFVTKENYIPEWRFYKDGNSWLCKITHKKKTICWLSVWDGYFKIGFYFTDKNKSGIFELPISESIKDNFCKSIPIGKLLPLTFSIKNSDQLPDLREVIIYKSKLK